jgi:hypothetical protein
VCWLGTAALTPAVASRPSIGLSSAASHDGAAATALVYAFGQNYKVSYAAWL